MTEELKEICLDVGHRRVGRLMRQNGISVVWTRKHKVTTDSDHKFNIAPNLLDRDFAAEQPNQKWAGDISYVWTREGWLYHFQCKLLLLAIFSAMLRETFLNN